MTKVFLSDSSFYDTIRKIDKSLKKNGRIPFQYKDYRRKYNRFGSEITFEYKTAVAVKRDDEMLIDANGVEYSIINDCVMINA